jgi:murein DD-endopeptidase MepM/ murein hydrolase activator NlpD
VGEVQAKLVKLEAMGDRVVGLAGVKADELKPLKRAPQGGAAPGGSGGPYVPLDHPSLEQLQGTIERLDAAADTNTDIFTLMESRLLESRLQALLVPSSAPVNVAVGSGFGFRLDPFTGRASLHTGLDFPAEVGTPVYAAAGGIVLASEWYAAYGNVLEIDHGNGLVTRYAHCASFEVERGALVKRGQLIARVGTTGRSTGPHLHFEVLVDGSPQDPARFLAAGSMAGKEFARRPMAASTPIAAASAPTVVRVPAAVAGAAPATIGLPSAGGNAPAPGAQGMPGSPAPPAWQAPSPSVIAVPPAALSSPQPAASR